jgi:predicted permease
MSMWSRIANVFRRDRVNQELDEELESHIEEAIAQGRDPAEVRRAFGASLQLREESLDIRLMAWLDSLRADAIFGWRQLKKSKVASTAAILSLALAIGSCTSAFRLIDALLFRPLAVAQPERLRVIAFESPGSNGKLAVYDSCSYPMFRQMRAAVEQQAELMAVSYAERVDLTYGSDQEMEKAYRQYVSGWMFRTLGLRPALGRVLTENDDLKPGASAVAVLSHDYWSSRFGRDRNVIGRSFRMGDTLYEIVGVTEESLTGTETGTVTGIFIPMMMKNARTLASSDNFWLRTLVQLKPGVADEPVQERMRATFRAIQEERAKGFTSIPKQRLEQFFNERLLLETASAGRSSLQRDYRQSLGALAILLALVLLIACANVANLMTAQAAARAREMALRMSLGAGRRRLMQLVLVESGWLALLATAIGALFAWWSAPFIVSMINPPNDPARLVLPADWRVLGFAMALTLVVTFLFGLAPALRASAVKPVSALKGGEDPHSRRRLMHALIAAQVTFCFLVLFVADLLATSFDRLSHQYTGFSAERILDLETVAAHPQAPVFWDQVAEHLRSVPGVEAVAIGAWPLMIGESAIGFISINSAPPTEVFSDFLSISPGWADTLKIPFIDGRDFRAGDANPSTAIVNEAFAKQYFNGENPVGKPFDRTNSVGGRVHFLIVGYVRDARSRDDMRLAIRPMAYVPFNALDDQGASRPAGRGTFVVRTSGANPLTLAATLRQEVARARPGFRVSNIRTQVEINQAHMVRERLLAMLGLFFAGVALLLAGVGLYGVLSYSVQQRRREIGIRIAIGAPAADIARRVTVDVFAMVLVGAVVGVVLGIGSVRYIATLIFGVNSTDWAVLAIPSLAILAAALLTAVPAVIRAVRIDPVTMLRAE